MAYDIVFKRGPKERLPLLDIGEPALTLDNKSMHIGTDVGNVEVMTDFVNKQTILENYLSAHSIPSTAKRGKLNTKLKGTTAENIVKNGNFADGTTGWSTSGTVSTFTVANKEATILAGTQHGSVYNLLKTKAGNKYYARADAKATSSQILFGFNSKVNHSGSGKYEVLSIILTASVAAEWLVLGDARASGRDNFYVKNVMCIDLTATFGAGNEPTKEQCDLMFANYFDGLQGAKPSVKSTSKNLFDKTKVTFGKYINVTDGEHGDNPIYNASDYMRIKPNTQYSASNFYHGAFYDINKIYISSALGMLSPANAYYLKLSVHVDVMNSFQVEEGSTTTIYEEYKSTEVTYKTLDGKPITLNRLPNGVCDEITDDGKFIRRIVEYTLQASDITSMWTNYANVDYATVTKQSNYIGKNLYLKNDTIFDKYPEFFTTTDYAKTEYIGKFTSEPHSTSYWVGFAKGTTLAQAQTALVGTKIIYELGKIQVLDTNATPLIAEPNGTVFITSNGPQPSVELSYPLNLGATLEGLINGDKILSSFANSLLNYYSIESEKSLKQKSYVSAVLGADGDLDDLPLGIFNVGEWFNIKNTPAGSYPYGTLMCIKMTANDGKVQMYFPDQLNGLIYYRLGFGSYKDWKILTPTDYQPSWITATLQNGWTGTLKYRKSNAGQLEIQGDITAGTITGLTIISNLPLGFRPTQNTVIPVIMMPDGNTNSRMLYMATNGDFKVPNGSNLIASQKIRFSAIMSTN